ncbi:uncharacterized protein N7515_006208 [Penicillium bovifimosum]|uniref:Pheromone n=1 Tax=Penicillium bovifimosum TaxID=126998 RepID=A0A9W9GU89_9EURO|nr:uncharacterized protein N7515_006208 [Penicillium bovifimosum]KAJ5130169.1 hypothetical protein N7515_006208 [Penicillium bovifimosum]
MKFSSVLVALAAAGAVQAAPSPQQAGLPTTVPKWCGHIGQGCKRTVESHNEFKRSASALAEAMAYTVPTSVSKWCGHVGQGCYKAKRAADAVEEVKRTTDNLAVAMADLEDDAGFEE